MRKISFSFLFLMAAFTFLFAEDTYYLKGKLGNFQIYLYFEDYTSEYPNNDNAIEGKYFYQSSLKDIALSGKRSDNTFIFYFDEYKGEFQEKFVLTKDSLNNFSGTWENDNGKKLVVELQPIKEEDVANPYEDMEIIKKLKKDDLYEYAKSAFIKFVKEDVDTVINNKHIEWFSEKHCDMRFFRLGKDFSESTKNIVNKKLKEIHLSEILDQLSCALSWYNKGNSIYYEVSIGYIDDHLLGFQIFSYWDCRFTHPDSSLSGYLIDLSDGKNYDIDDILSFDKSVTTYSDDDNDSAFESFSNYRTNFFAPQLYKVMNSLYHFSKLKVDGCDYTNIEHWDFPSWNFTSKGIEFTPSFNWNTRNCEGPFLVPFSKLKKFKNPKFPYNFPK